MLRHYVNGTMGFAELGRRLERDPKNLMRSLSPKGNPAASNLLTIFKECRKAGNFTVQTRVEPVGASPMCVQPA